MTLRNLPPSERNTKTLRHTSLHPFTTNIPLPRASESSPPLSNPFLSTSSATTKVSHLSTQVPYPTSKISNPTTQILNPSAHVSKTSTKISNPSTQISHTTTQITNSFGQITFPYTCLSISSQISLPNLIPHSLHPTHQSLRPIHPSPHRSHLYHPLRQSFHQIPPSHHHTLLPHITPLSLWPHPQLLPIYQTPSNLPGGDLQAQLLHFLTTWAQTIQASQPTIPQPTPIPPTPSTPAYDLDAELAAHVATHFTP